MRKDSSNSISDGSIKVAKKPIEKSSVEQTCSDLQSLLNVSTKSQERLITSRSATELASVNQKVSPPHVPKQKVTSPSPPVTFDVELGEIERALTDTRKSIDAKFFRSLANSSSPFFRPGKPPGLTSPEEYENSDENDARLPALEKESLNYGTTSSDFEIEVMRVNSPGNDWTVTNKYDRSSDDSKENKNRKSPPKPPPKTYQHIVEKNNCTGGRGLQIENIPLQRGEKGNRELKSPPVPPKPVQNKQSKVTADAKVPKEASIVCTTQNSYTDKKSASSKKVPLKSVESVHQGEKIQSIVTASPSNPGVVTASACSQGGIFSVSASKDGVVTVGANIKSHKKSGSYVSSVTSMDDHGSYSDSSMRSVETLTSEKDSDSQKGSLVRTKVRDAKDIINERSQHKQAKSKVRVAVKKANSFDDNSFNPSQ